MWGVGVVFILSFHFFIFTDIDRYIDMRLRTVVAIFVYPCAASYCMIKISPKSISRWLKLIIASRYLHVCIISFPVDLWPLTIIRLGNELIYQMHSYCNNNTKIIVIRQYMIYIFFLRLKTKSLNALLPLRPNWQESGFFLLTDRSV